MGNSMPDVNDYLAGAILANGFIWIWNLILRQFRIPLSRLPVMLLADISLAIYLLAGGVSAYLVGRRASRRHLIVSLKVSFLSWLLSILLVLSMALKPIVGSIIIFLLCLHVGGVAGGYFALKRRLRRRAENS